MVAAPKSEVEAKIVKPADRKISDVRAYCVYCYPYHGVVVAFSFAAMVALVLAGWWEIRWMARVCPHPRHKAIGANQMP